MVFRPRLSSDFRDACSWGRVAVAGGPKICVLCVSWEKSVPAVLCRLSQSLHSLERGVIAQTYRWQTWYSKGEVTCVGSGIIEIEAHFYNFMSFPYNFFHKHCLWSSRLHQWAFVDFFLLLNCWKKWWEDHLCQWRELVCMERPHGIPWRAAFASYQMASLRSQTEGITLCTFLLSSRGLPWGQLSVALLLFEAVPWVVSITSPFLTRVSCHLVCGLQRS